VTLHTFAQWPCAVTLTVTLHSDVAHVAQSNG
jgi:hypothetical protein